MQQLSIFDTADAPAEREVGFKYRWHLIDNGSTAATVIPGAESVIIMGMYHSSLSRLNIKISYGDYERFIDVTKLLEVGP